MIQDGTERWYEDTLEDAITSMIQGARQWNHDYIRKDDIKVYPAMPPKALEVSQADYDLLQEIRRGAKVVLDHDDRRIRYRLTDEECDMIIEVREGRLQVT